MVVCILLILVIVCLVDIHSVLRDIRDKELMVRINVKKENVDES